MATAKGSKQPRRSCVFTGRKTVSGWKKSEKGSLKSGGVGNKVKGRSKRQVKPNLKKVRAVINGKTVRVYASAKAIKSGLVIKPMWKNVSVSE
ncbi:MAG: 50S ribosomal protein L28 [Planctomycetes bacterium]|nr:50S ribosomal protein L28 [Planctomycetota bacterium]